MGALFLKDLAKVPRGLDGRVEGRKSGGGLMLRLRRRARARRRRRAPGAEADQCTSSRRSSAASSGIRRGGPRARWRTLSMPRAYPAPREGRGAPTTIHGNWRLGGQASSTTSFISAEFCLQLPALRERPHHAQTHRALETPKSELAHLRTCRNCALSMHALWQEVKTAAERPFVSRPHPRSPGGIRSERARRPAYPLVGACSDAAPAAADFSKIGAQAYGCSNARNRGTCDNRLVISRAMCLSLSVLERARRPT